MLFLCLPSSEVTFQIDSDDLKPSAVESAESDDTFVQGNLLIRCVTIIYDFLYAPVIFTVTLFYDAS